jgi:hypothetical protein
VTNGPAGQRWLFGLLEASLVLLVLGTIHWAISRKRGKSGRWWEKVSSPIPMLLAFAFFLFGSLGPKEDNKRSVSAQPPPGRPAHRTSRSPSIVCVGPFGPAGSAAIGVRADGFADCDTATLVVGRCGDGSCTNHDTEIGNVTFHCATRPDRDLAGVLRFTCVGPGQSVTWLGPKPS